MLADVRSALRQGRLHPWVFAGATLSLAIGMSVATAVFSVVDAALFRPLPFASPDRLVHIAETIPQPEGRPRIDLSRIPAKQFLAARADAKSLADIAAWAPYDMGRYRATLAGADVRPVSGVKVTVNFFRLLGVRPFLGRDFDAGEGFGTQRVAILSHDFWSVRYGADSSLVGREVLLGGVPHRVIGVMPERFGYPPVDAWFPMPLATIQAIADDKSQRDDDWPPFDTIGRLRPGATIDELSAELAVIYKRVYGTHEWRNVRSSRAQPLAEWVAQPMREAMQLWIAIAMLVGILCAVNFATVSLARGMRRRAELAVRAAMGASGGAIVRLLVVEAVLTALAGGVLAIVLGAWILRFVEIWFSGGAMVLTPAMRWSTMAFALAATSIVGVLFAIAPAIDLSRMDLRSRLQSDGAQATERRGALRGRRLLVGLQLTLALTAVSVVAALIDADRRQWAMDVGLDHRGLLLGSLTAVGPDGIDAHAVLERVRAVPGVVGASLLETRGGAVAWTDDRHADAFGAPMSYVTPEYFTTLGVKLVAGRMPNAAEIADSTTALLSAFTARQAFGSAQGAIGRRLHLKRPGRPGVWVTITGVLPEFGGRALFYLGSAVYRVRESVPARGQLVVRVLGDIPRATLGVGQAIQSFGPGLTISDVFPARYLVEGDSESRRGRTFFVMSVGALALLLAVIGMYGLTAYNTEVRAREFGIRIALGAGAARLAHVLLDDLVPLAAVGVVVAIIGAARLSAFLDDRFRTPLAEQPVLQFHAAPAGWAAAALLFVTMLGVAAPLWRVLRMDVMRVIQGGSVNS